MAQSTISQTPDVIFHVSITDRHIGISADLPLPLSLGEDEAVLLEANLNNAMELVLAPYFAVARSGL